MNHATIAAGLRAAAALTPEKIALTTHDRAISYEALVRNINRVSNLARGTLGLSTGDRALLIAPNSIRFIEIFLGLAEAGIAVSPVSLLATRADVERIRNELDARLSFVDPSYAHLAEPHSAMLLDERFDRMLEESTDAAPTWPLGAEDVFCILFTSGSSGQPKGVMLSHRARVDHMRYGMAENWGVHGPEARVLTAAPFSNGGAVIQPLAALTFGGSCHIMAKFDPEEVMDNIERRSITFMSLVPTQYHRIAQLSADKLAPSRLRSLQAVASFGAPMTPNAKQRLIAIFGENKFFDSYGTTEAGSITCLRPQDQLHKPGSVGKPTPTAEVRIDSQTGEIWVRSSWLFSGYWRNPQATAQSLIDGWCATGDIGRWDDEGYLYLLDRKANMIISGGQNVYPREVENVLAEHPQVSQCAVVGQRDDEWGEIVTAIVVMQPGQNITDDELRAFCATRLTRYKVPKRFEFWTSLPQNATGKIDHRGIRESLNNRS